MRKLFMLAVRIWSKTRNLQPALSGILIGIMCGVAVGATMLWATETEGNPLWLFPAMLVSFIAGAFFFWSDRIYDGRHETAEFFGSMFVGLGIGWIIPPPFVVQIDVDVVKTIIGMHIGIGILAYCAIMASTWWRKYRQTNIMPSLLTLN